MLLQIAKFHSFFYGWIIFHCVYMYHIFFIHLSVDGHLGCYHILAIVNNTAMNIGVHVSFLINVFIFFKYIPFGYMCFPYFLPTGRCGPMILMLMLIFHWPCDYNITLPSAHLIQSSPYHLFGLNFAMKPTYSLEFMWMLFTKTGKNHVNVFSDLVSPSDHSAKSSPDIYLFYPLLSA